MEWAEKARELIKDRKWAVFMTVCGVIGMLLVMISSFIPNKDTIKESKAAESRH